MGDALAQRLAAHFDRRFCVLTGNGTTAIALALEAIAARRGTGEVLVPAIGCPTIAQAVEYAGFTARWIDVRLEDATVDLDSLRRNISGRSQAVLGVHIYGHAYDVAAVHALAREHDLPVIEDAAQSMGGSYDGRPLGSFGDFAILSFSGTKIVDAGGGGALLTDDAEAAERARRAVAVMPLPESSVASSLDHLSHWQLYHGAMNHLRVHPEARIDFVWRGGSPLFRALFLRRFPEEKTEAIERGLGALPELVEGRLERAERYHAGLEGLPVARSDAWRRSATIWRYNVLLPSRRRTNEISDFLRKSGVAASNHYWSLADLFSGNKSLPNANEIGRRIVNFWVDRSATDQKIDRACALLREALERD